jgi:hypothetical protein
MKKTSVGIGREALLLPRRRLPYAIGVTPNRHADWQDQGLLGDSDPADTHDAIELAVLKRMIGAAGPSRAKRAWRVIRPRFRERSPACYKAAWAIVDKELERHALALTPAELAKSAALESLVWVIPLGPVSREAQESFSAHAREPMDEAARSIVRS